MALTILDDSISSDRTAHTARLAFGQDHRWEVSWLPGRHVDRNSAITAMVLADVTGPGDMHAGHQLWIFVEGWAGELGLTANEVLAQTARPRGWAEAEEKAAVQADPEAER
jgi:hypothetical protein